MKAKANIAGHPLHPMLITVPIGMLIGALVLDVAAVAGSLATWLPAAALLTILGTGLLLIAAIPGFLDYRNVVPKQGPVRKTANKHVALGVTLEGLFIVSAVVHGFAWRGMDPGLLQGALWLNVLGAIGLGVQGWLGSSLVYQGHVAVIEQQGQQAQRETRREARREHRRTPSRT